MWLPSLVQRDTLEMHLWLVARSFPLPRSRIHRVTVSNYQPFA